MMVDRVEETDVLIIGSGVSGLFTAFKLAETHKIFILSKKQEYESSTYYAQGGIASVFSLTDSFEAHIKDTHKAGVNLCREDVVTFCVEEAPERIHELIDLGVQFSKRDGHDNEYDLTKEGGHSHRRILHAKDMTGQEIERALLQACHAHPNITFYEYHMAVDFILDDPLSESPRCIGAFVFDQEQEQVFSVKASSVLIASGGAGKVYLYTSNPDVCTGDGIAMAYRAGARIANMEFMQFHPTCLFHPHAKSFLISEALRGEGGILRNHKNERFMEGTHPLKELAPRDIVARAIDAEIKKSGHDNVFLDMTHLDGEFLKDRFPNIYQTCLQFGIDLTTQPIPVVPAAHYTCGGIVIDEYGRTDIPGLYAVGEVSCSGLHGANRLASNSLLEGVVFAHRVVESIKVDPPSLFDGTLPQWDPGTAVDSDEAIVVSHNWDEVRRLMWNYVGIVRSNKRLQRAKRRLQLLKEEIDEYYWRVLVSSDLLELRNIVTIADIIVESALLRKESRGLHFTVDFPESDDQDWKVETIAHRPPKTKKRPKVWETPQMSTLPLLKKRK